MEHETPHQFTSPQVTELPLVRYWDTGDDFGDFTREIETSPEGLAPVPKRLAVQPDYTTGYQKQLAFHEQELRDADKRGFPSGQVAYHVSRVNLLQDLLASKP